MKQMLAGLWLLMLLVPAAHANDPESLRYYRMCMVLFPETRTWQVVDSLPSPEAEKMQRDRGLLRSIYLKTQQNILMENQYCSFITRALYERFDLSTFKSVDLDGDGYADVMYSGDIECDEGSAAVTWFGGPDGFAERDVAIVPLRVLKVEMGPPRRICGINIGCCADPVDEYVMGDVANPWGIARLRVHKALDLPKGMKSAGTSYVARHKLVLRLAPTMFGEIAARYLPGAKGKILARFRDGRGRRWGLLAVDRASGALRSESADDVDVGWIRLE